MKNLSSLTKNMIICMTLVALTGLALSYFFLDHGIRLGAMLGILLGTALSFFRYLSLERSVDKSLGMEPHRGKAHAQVQYFVRLAVTIAVFLFAGMNHPNVNFYGVAYGAINMQVSIYICAFIMRRQALKEQENTETTDPHQ